MQLRTDESIHDDAAFTELYQCHAHTVLSFIWRYIYTREDAEDVLLEVFLAALERNALQGLSEREQLAWLRRVAHNKCVDIYRRVQRRSAVPLDSALEILYEDEARSPERLALQTEENAMLHRLLAQLPEQQQSVLRLHFAYDMRSPEIARRLKKSEGSIRKLLSRGLNSLRKVYWQEIKERGSVE